MGFPSSPSKSVVPSPKSVRNCFFFFPCGKARFRALKTHERFGGVLESPISIQSGPLDTRDTPGSGLLSGSAIGSSERGDLRFPVPAGSLVFMRSVLRQSSDLSLTSCFYFAPHLPILISLLACRLSVFFMFAILWPISTPDLHLIWPLPFSSAQVAHSVVDWEEGERFAIVFFNKRHIDYCKQLDDNGIEAAIERERQPRPSVFALRRPIPHMSLFTPFSSCLPSGDVGGCELGTLGAMVAWAPLNPAHERVMARRERGASRGVIFSPRKGAVDDKLGPVPPAAQLNPSPELGMPAPR